MFGVIVALLAIIGAVSVDHGYNNARVSKHIPRLIFRSHEDRITNLHIKFKEFLNRTTTDNPQYVQVYFDANDRADFIRTYFPQYLPYYNSLIPGAFKSDMWRYLVIYRYGGIYNDMGMRYAKTINKVVSFDMDEFVGAVDIDATAIINGFFAAYSGHPILKKTIELIVDNIKNYRYGCDNIDITGPRVFGRALKLFFFAQPYSPRPIKVGKYIHSHCKPLNTSTHVYKLHLLNFSLSSHQHRLASTRSIWDRLQLISEESGEVCIRNKFDGYMEAIYNKSRGSGAAKGGLKYGEMWAMRAVYHPREGHHASPPRNSTSVRINYMDTNNLFKQGKSIWYLHNRTKIIFPDYQTFIDMGLRECMAIAALTPSTSESFSKLPEYTLGSTVRDRDSIELAKNIGRINLWGTANCNASMLDQGTVAKDINHAELLEYTRSRSGSSGSDQLVRTLTYKEFEMLVER